MKLGHILYKVNNLDEAVQEYTRKGFTVEYGRKKNPYNALIYFAEGPYLELFHNSGMPSFVKRVLDLIGKKALVHRLNTWENSKEGLIAVALENDRSDVDIEQQILDKANLKYFKGRSGRTDTKGRKLRFQGIMPDEMAVPFFGTKFNVNVRPPKNYVHPNGVKRIKSVSFGTKAEFVPVIKQLCDDDGLTLFIGEGVKDLEFEYVDSNQT
ncbi:MAG: VOC family protein [Chloroflexota bacterium]